MSTLNVKEYLYNLLATNASLQSKLGGTASDKKVYPSFPDREEQFPCVVYSIIDSSTNEVPRDTSITDYQIECYSKLSQLEVEEIADLIKLIVQYKASDSPRLFFSIKTNEVDDNDTSRKLFAKYLRFRITHRF